MSKTQEHKWSICPDCGGYSSEGHTGTERCRAYKPAQGHTPGPWQFVGHFDAVEISVSDKSIAAWDGADWEIDSELEANARLIAAAPDLLAELTKAADTFADLARALSLLRRETLAEACRIAEQSNRATIARAEGRAQ